MLESRAKVLDFTEPFSYDKLGFLYKKPGKEAKVNDLPVF